MKELKVLAVVVFFTLITYWGVEPYAHSVMHKHVEGHDFKYPDLKPAPKGNPEKGKQLIATCTGCHSIESQGIKAPMDALAASKAYGVNPPDLSNAGALYDEKFLVDLMQNPNHATKVKKFAMPPSVGSAQDAADIAAYLKSIAPKEISNKEAFESACGRCHAMRYAKWTQLGEIPKTKPNIKTKQDPELMKFKLQVAEYQENLANYMGKLPPDLSTIIRARSKQYLETFVEDPQTQLPGTAMPRVGVTKEAYEKIEQYLEAVGDSSKPDRERIGPWVIGYFVIFTLLAYLWYKSNWRDIV
ncbi:MAG: cytochrome c1 [Epsilonproteobacteria bacterium]|nr:cytochrome c1 [Campylobacterota bacterium]